jgi:hypothetical protein
MPARQRKPVMSVASTFLFITNFDGRFAIFRAVDSLGGGA